MPSRQNLFKWVALFLVAVLAAYLTFYKLGSSFLENWDEAWVGEAVREMIRRGEPVVLYWNKTVWLDKPPLYFWLSSISSQLLGLSEFSLRLTSALAGLILIIWVWQYTYREYHLLPALLAFSSLALNNIFIWRARSGNLDLLASLLIFATYFVILSKHKQKYLLLGFLLALIYLTKASLVFFPLGVLFLHEFLFNRPNIKRNLKEYLKLFLLLLIIPGIWLFLGWQKVGSDFPNYYLFWSDQGAANLSLSNFKTDYLWYAYYSLQRRFFWVLILGAIFLLRKMTQPKLFLLLLYGFLLLVELSFAEKRNNWYLVPLMPFWAIIIAEGASGFLNLFKNRALYLAAALSVVILSGYVSYKTYLINIRSIINSEGPAAQAQLGVILNKITQPEEIIVRVDHLYPATIYYSDRRVLSSPENAETRDYFISRKDLLAKIRTGKIKWLTGKKDDLNYFVKTLGNVEWLLIAQERDEQVLSFKAE